MMWMRLSVASLAVVVLIAACAPLTTPTPRPAPTRASGPYVYYFPVAGKILPTTRKGVALLGGCDTAGTVGATHIYTYWYRDPHCAGATWDAMIWGRDQVDAEVDASAHLLLFNEPNERSQANITPGEAVELLRRVEERLPHARIVSPAPSQNNPAWLDETRALYIERYGDAPRWDVLALHCYFANREMMDGCKAMLVEYAHKAREWGAAEIWLTEFAGFPHFADVDAVALEAEFIDWLKSSGVAKRWYHFASRWETSWGDGCPGCELYALITNGVITSHGKMYREK